jgi:hypothetical protein
MLSLLYIFKMLTRLGTEFVTAEGIGVPLFSLTPDPCPLKDLCRQHS